MDCIENKTFDELRVGDAASAVRTLSDKDIELFAVLRGNDINPAHREKWYVTDDMLYQVLAPNMWGSALISWVVGTQLPGPGSVYRAQNLHFHEAMKVGDSVKVTVTVTRKDADDYSVTLDCKGGNQHGQRVLSGTAWVVAPTQKICSPPTELPIVYFEEHGSRLKQLVELADSFPAVTAAVVHPVDAVSLEGAIRAAEANLIRPVLVGPVAKVRNAATTAGIAISSYEIIDVPHSHAAAAKAVELAQSGAVQILMKGSLHTDELMAQVVRKDAGLRTERRISHVYVMDVSTYPKLLLITDAAINIEPNLLEKRDIAQNAIDLAHVIGLEQPKVAILSAVETVTPELKATMDAAALCKMADRGQITGGILDGPLAFDNAISKRAANTKGIVSPVAGDADILLVPDLEAGNMLAKQLEYLANAAAAGIVLGARVPIVLTSRADGNLVRMASCALAVLVAEHKRQVLP